MSVGDLDIVRIGACSEMCGPSMHWMQVAIKPAKPLAFGMIDGRVPVFGLPGNPVSSMVSFELFARPALPHAWAATRARQADRCGGRRRRPARECRRQGAPAAGASSSVDRRGRLHVRPSGGQDSHQLRAMAEANALAVLPDG